MNCLCHSVLDLQKEFHLFQLPYYRNKPEISTWTEWSITKSTGTWGFTFSGSPSKFTIASLNAAIDKSRFIFLLITLALYSSLCYSQNLIQRDLELKRIDLVNEIKNIQNLINNSKDEEKLVVENIENLNYKLNLQNEIIKITNNELNIISVSIETTKR